MELYLKDSNKKTPVQAKDNKKVTPVAKKNQKKKGTVQEEEKKDEEDPGFIWDLYNPNIGFKIAN